MDIISEIEFLNSKLREVLQQYTIKMSELSVYDQSELVQKSQMLSNLQKISQSVANTHKDIISTITEQKQNVEKYMRNVEEKFNSIRQNIYVPQKQPIDKSSEQNTAKKAIAKPQKANVQKEQDWITVTRNKPKKKNKHRTTNDNKTHDIPKLVKREVAPDTFIDAVTIGAPMDCHKYPGWWCYCPDWGKFCLSVNQQIIIGNTTSILPTGEVPRKFFEHRRAETSDWATSNFYVPRERNAESRDSRIFTNKMKFVPASRLPERHETYYYRLGSRDTLKNDIVSVKPEDYRLFNDLTCNFLLCLTAAGDEMLRRKSTGMF